MEKSGFASGYVVQGGDISSKVGRVTGALHDSVKAVHINSCIMPDPGNIPDSEYNDLEMDGLRRAAELKRIGSAYATEHATRTSTIGAVLSSSRSLCLHGLGRSSLSGRTTTCRWRQSLPTCRSTGSQSVLRLASTLIASYSHRAMSWLMERTNGIFKKPLGFSWFPREFAPIPQAWAATTGDLGFWRQHNKGGHFAALKRPVELLSDFEDFVAEVWDV